MFAIRIRLAVVLGVAMVAVVLGVVDGVPAGADDVDSRSVAAVFEGEVLDLAAGWGEAQACLVWESRGVLECFRSEADLDTRLVELSTDPVGPSPGGMRASQCSSSVRLYDGVVYTGQLLYIADRLQWINLSSYGFSNRTSSFKIGACSAYLADYDSGGGSWYPTSGTQAWDVAPTMESGWSNRVSSIYLQ